MKYKEIEVDQSTEYDSSKYPTSGIWLNTESGNTFYINKQTGCFLLLEHRGAADKVFETMRDEQIIDHLSKPQQLEVVQEAEGTVSESFALKLVAIVTADKRTGNKEFDL